MIFRRTILIILMTIVSVFSVSSIKAETISPSYYRKVIQNVFSTTNIYEISKHDPNIDDAKANQYLNEVADLTIKISKLTDNFKEYKGINNVYYINNNVGKNIEIDKLLYDVLVLAEQYKELTNGYFDISIGKIIDEWKAIMDSGEEISKNDFEQKVTEIKQIPVINNGIELTKDDSKYYVKIKEGVKIDLGAIAKGYAVGLVDKYFKDKGLTYYRIEGSSSSLVYGENYYRDENMFHIGITNPFVYDYGYLRVKNVSMTTSGDTEQNELIHGKLIHHLISPKTKQPENNYRLLTIINDDPALADALTTAMFAMDEETLIKWANDNGIKDYIVFKSNKEIISNFNNYEFVLTSNEEDPIKATLKDWLIVSGIVVFVAGAIYLIARKKEIKE
ncbi:MAG TPA: hypothetical protein GX012_01005 [Acholeplasma sp.]|nr:hypothetical protein [Acholeplasma sp.]